MFGWADAAKIRDAADVPQQPDRWAIDGAGSHLGIFGQCLERGQIIAFAHPRQPCVFSAFFQGLQQALDRPELQPRVAPLQTGHRAKAVVFNRLDGFNIRLPGLSGDAKGAMGQVSPGPARNLGQLIGGQMAHPHAVKFDQG